MRMSHVNACFQECPINSDMKSDYEDADSIGRGDTAYAVMLVSRSEPNKMGNNRPTVSSNVGEKNAGSLGLNPADADSIGENPADADMLVISSIEPNGKTDGSTVDASTSVKVGGTVDAKVAESFLGKMSSAEDNNTSWPTLKSLNWNRPHVRIKPDGSTADASTALAR